MDGVLVIFTLQAGTDHHTTAELMVPGLQKKPPPMRSCPGWRFESDSSRELFSRARMAHFAPRNLPWK